MLSNFQSSTHHIDLTIISSIYTHSLHSDYDQFHISWARDLSSVAFSIPSIIPKIKKKKKISSWYLYSAQYFHIWHS